MSESEYDSEYSDRNHNNDVVGNSNESDYKSCDDSGHGEHNNDENSDDESIVDVGADIGSIGFKEENVKRRVSLDDDDDNDYDYDDGSGGGDSDDEDDTGCDVDDGSSGGGDSDDEDKEIGDGIGFERGNSNGNVDEDHPLYAKAKIHLGIDDGTVENCCLDQGNMTVDHITYNRIEYPATQNIRYARLKEQFELATRHAKENEEIYKKFMVLLSSAVNSYNCVGTAEQDQPNNCVQPPLSQVDRRKRGRVSDSDVQNRAKYPKKSKSGSTRAKPNNVSLTM